MEKICSKCKTKRNLSEFYEDKRTKDGLYSACKGCCNHKSSSDKNYAIEYRLAHKKEIKDYRKQYRIKNRDKHRLYNKKYKSNPVEKAKNRSRKKAKKIKLKGKCCEVCGYKKMLHRHHPDYNKPLDVIILCVKCHNDLHYKLNHLPSPKREDK